MCSCDKATVGSAVWSRDETPGLLEGGEYVVYIFISLGDKASFVFMRCPQGVWVVVRRAAVALRQV